MPGGVLPGVEVELACALRTHTPAWQLASAPTEATHCASSLQPAVHTACAPSVAFISQRDCSAASLTT
jgi:hypothetical protein